MRPSSWTRRDWAILAGVLGVSLLVRAVARAALGEFPPIYDEAGYLQRAHAFAAWIANLVRGEAPGHAVVTTAYGRGTWPPLHPLTLALWSLVFGPSVAAARLLQLVLSVASTGLVLEVTKRLCGGRAALAAGLLHALLPGFVAFSGYLWSETLFIFLVLAAVSLLLWLLRLRHPRLAVSALAGALLGVLTAAACLTRAAGLPLLLTLPLWLGLRCRAHRQTVLAALALAAMVTLAPWHALIYRFEGSFHLLATSGGYNLLLGNNPHPEKSRTELQRIIRQSARERGLDEDGAARRLALAEIRARPGRAALGVIARTRVLLLPDQFVLRHLFGAVYDPARVRWPLLWFFAVVLSQVGVGVGLVRGFFCVDWHDADLRLLLLLGGSLLVLPALTVANTRMTLPVLALLLPFAATGLVAAARRGATLASGLAGALLVANIAAPPYGAEELVQQPSGYYAEPLAVIDRLVRGSLVASDCLRLRSADGGERRIRAEAGGGYRFPGGRRRTLVLRSSGRPTRIDTFGVAPAHPPELVVDDLAAGASVHISDPLEASSWLRWRETGIDGVELKWCGMGRFVDTSAFRR